MLRLLQTTSALLLHRILLITGWKRKTIYANLSYLGYPKNLRTTLLANLAADLSRFATGVFPDQRILAKCTQESLSGLRNGGLLLTAHLGNFELMGAWLEELGVPVRAAHLPMQSSWSNRLLLHFRNRNGSYVGDYYRHPKRMVQDIRSGCLVAFLADQDERSSSALSGVLFDKPIHCSALPDWLLSNTGCPVWFAYIRETQQPCAWELVIQPIPPLQKTAAPLISQYNLWLEERIQEAPAYWYGWTHRRFFSTHPDLYK